MQGSVASVNLIFGVPTPLKEYRPGSAHVQDQIVDILDYARQAYLGPKVPLVPLPFQTSDDWTAFHGIWQDDETMEESPLEVHCSGLGAACNSERPYDIFLQIHAQIKVSHILTRICCFTPDSASPLNLFVF